MEEVIDIADILDNLPNFDLDILGIKYEALSNVSQQDATTELASISNISSTKSTPSTSATRPGPLGARRSTTQLAAQVVQKSGIISNKQRYKINKTSWNEHRY